MRACLFYLIAAAALVGGVCWMADDFLSMPEVHVSYSTQECVRVLLADGTEGDCADLPDKYHHVWVQ